MIISKDSSDSAFQIQGYNPGEIIINQDSYTKGLIITPTQLMTDCLPRSLKEINEINLQLIASLEPETVLFGTGDTFILPSTELKEQCKQLSLSVEFMSTPAACRTFMALTAEGRDVAAALII